MEMTAATKSSGVVLLTLIIFIPAFYSLKLYSSFSFLLSFSSSRYFSPVHHLFINAIVCTGVTKIDEVELSNTISEDGGHYCISTNDAFEITCSVLKQNAFNMKQM